MGKNQSTPFEDSQGMPFVKSPHPFLVYLMGFVYVCALAAGCALIFIDTGCDIDNSEPLSGHGKWLFTLILGLASAIFASYGALIFCKKHLYRWYIHLWLYPPIYTTFFLLWLIEFGMYAVPFLNGDDSVPGMVCMKKIIYTSAAGLPLWTVIALVSFFDWRKFRNVEEFANQSKEEGGWESSGAAYPMDDYTGANYGAHHGGSH